MKRFRSSACAVGGAPCWQGRNNTLGLSHGGTDERRRAHDGTSRDARRRRDTPVTRTHTPRVRWLDQHSDRHAPGITKSAICVQRFDDSLNSAIHTTYCSWLRSSSMHKPGDPPLKVIRYEITFSFSVRHQRFNVTKKKKGELERLGDGEMKRRLRDR